MLNLPALSRAIDFNDIKTTETTFKMSLPQEPARRLDDLLLFAMVDSSCRPAEALRVRRVLTSTKASIRPLLATMSISPRGVRKLRARIS